MWNFTSFDGFYNQVGIALLFLSVGYIIFHYVKAHNR